MPLETFGGTTHLAQVGRTQVLILLIVQEAHSPFLEARDLCLTLGRLGTTQLGFGTMVGVWATTLARVTAGTTDGITDGGGTTLTAGTMAGAMVMILTDMDTTLMVTDTILTVGIMVGIMVGVGTTAGITTILGQLPAMVALAQEQPQPAQRLERTTAIVDLLNTPQPEVRV